jgi:hypothetical protein
MECGDYRAGFVATFRKYEGQLTDEKDAQGRTVKVTVASFARHLGVNPETFRLWIKRQDPSTLVPAPRNRRLEFVRQTARTDPQTLVDAVMELPEERAKDIAHQIHRRQLERAGADFTEQGRKERQARTSEHFDPLHRSLNALQVVATLEKAADQLRHLPADLTDADHREIDAAVDDVILARTEMHMRAEVDS